MDTTTSNTEQVTNGSHQQTTTTGELDLDALLAMDHAALAQLYASAEVPTIEELSGDLRGRMLIGPWAPPAVANAMRALARAPWFPWRGKSFSAKSPERGEGVNRVVSDRRRWFRFDTTVGKSRAGDFDAVQLDYDQPSNPFFIRAIKDEVRRVRPGLFLGQAWVQTSGKTHLALWFALEKRR
jgi:hypothetical protein